MAEETYADWTFAELKEEAGTREIEGRSAMNKDELVAALEADDAGEETEETEEAPSMDEVAEMLGTARSQVEAALAKVQAAIDTDDRTDPARFLALKDTRAVLLDALNHHLTLEVPEVAEEAAEEAEGEEEAV